MPTKGNVSQAPSSTSRGHPASTATSLTPSDQGACSTQSTAFHQKHLSPSQTTTGASASYTSQVLSERPPAYSATIASSYELSRSEVSRRECIERNKSELFSYARMGDISGINAYIKSKRILLIQNTLGEDAVVIAYQNHHLECVTMLLKEYIQRNLLTHELCLYYESHNLLPPFIALEQKESLLLQNLVQIYNHHLCDCKNSEGHSILMQQILNRGDISQLLARGPTLRNAQSNEGLSALMLAIITKQKASYGALLRNSNVSLTTRTGANAIHFAINQDSPDLKFIEDLIRFDCDPTQESKEHGNALCISISRNHFELVKKFASYSGMKLDSVSSDGLTCLELALSSYLRNPTNRQSLLILEHLLDETPILTLNYDAKSRLTHPLIFTASYPNIPTAHRNAVISKLLSYKNLSLDNPNIFHAFIQHGASYANIKELLNLGSPLPIEDRPHKSAPYLIRAIQHQNEDAFDAILEYIQAQDPQLINASNHNKETALMHVTIQKPQTESKSCESDIPFLNRLLATPKIDIHVQRTSDGCTAMMLALHHRHEAHFNTLFKYALSNSDHSIDWITLQNSEQQDLFMIAFSLELFDIARNILSTILQRSNDLDLFNHYINHQIFPLFLACQYSDQALFNLCLPLSPKNAHLYKDAKGNNILMALILAKMPIPEEFIYPEMISTQNHQQQTPLSLAIENGVDHLIDRTIELNLIHLNEEKPYGNLFTLAAKHRRGIAFMQKLAKNSTSTSYLYTRNSDGHTALEELLIYPADLPAIDYLLHTLELNFNLYKMSSTPLLFAFIRSRNIDLLEQYLQSSQIDFNSKDIYGRNALDVCIDTHQADMLLMLIKYGYPFQQQSFHTLIDQVLQRKNYTILKSLIENLQNINSELLELLDLKSHKTLLMKMLQEKDCPIELFQTLLSIDFDASIQTPISKENALIQSILLPFNSEESRYSIVAMLVRNISQRDRRLLNLTTSQGDTALTTAVEKNNVAIVQLLLIAQADATIPNSKGQPLQISIQRAHHEITDLIISHFIQYSEKDLWETKSSLSRSSSVESTLYLANKHSSPCLGKLIQLYPMDLLIKDLFKKSSSEKELQHIFNDPDLLATLLSRFKTEECRIPDNRGDFAWKAMLEVNFTCPEQLKNLEDFIDIAPILHPFNSVKKYTPLSTEFVERLYRKVNHPYQTDALKILLEKNHHINTTLANHIIYYLMARFSDDFICEILPILHNHISPSTTIHTQYSPFDLSFLERRDRSLNPKTTSLLSYAKKTEAPKSLHYLSLHKPPRRTNPQSTEIYEQPSSSCTIL